MQQCAENNINNFKKQNVITRLRPHTSTKQQDLFCNDAIINNVFQFLNKFANDMTNGVMPVQIASFNYNYNINVMIINKYKTNACPDGTEMDCRENKNCENKSSNRYRCNDNKKNDKNNEISQIKFTGTNDTNCQNNINYNNTFSDVKIDLANANVTKFIDITLFKIGNMEPRRNIPQMEKSDFENAIIRQFKSAKQLYMINVTVLYVDKSCFDPFIMKCSCITLIKNCEITGFIELCEYNLKPQVSFVCYDNYDDKLFALKKDISSNCLKNIEQPYRNDKNNKKPETGKDYETDKNIHNKRYYEPLNATAKECIELELNKMADENSNSRVPRVVEEIIR